MYTNCPFADQDPALRATNFTSGRKYNGKEYHIDTITLHCVVGHLSMKSLASCFQGTRRASSNYGVMDDGKVGLFVEEKDRSWCSSSSANDVRAITVEIDSDATAPYAMTDGAVNGAIKLCIDICQRNGIKKMIWIADKEKALAKQQKLAEGEGIFTVHRWFANKSCPGDFLYNKMGWVCDQVNAALEGIPFESVVEPEKPKTIEELAKEVIDGKWGVGVDRINRLTEAGYDYKAVQKRVNEILAPAPKYYHVQCGAFKEKANADALVARLKAKGYPTYVPYIDGLYKVQVAACSKKENADKIALELAFAGFDTYISFY